MEVNQEINELEKRMNELKFTQLYPERLKSILRLDEEDLENVSNLKVNAKYHISTNDNDEYYSDEDANLEVSYDYNKSNNLIYNIRLVVNYNRYEDYNCRYDGQLSCNSEISINSESGKDFDWKYEEDVEIHVDDEYKDCCNIMNQIFEYNDHEKSNWSNLIYKITKQKSD
jgi:hypothetical protein